jgi:rhodanese-related sulfurtransferase
VRHDPSSGVSPTEALSLTREGALLLDVREDDEWAAGHAAEAVSLPMSRLAAHVQTLPPDRLIICVCHVGARSAMVARALSGGGWDAVNLSGGMTAWVAAGLPVVQHVASRGAVA